MNTDIIESTYVANAVNIMKEKKSVAKWGFGMAPISSRMRQRYDAAVSNHFQTDEWRRSGQPSSPGIP